VRILPELGGARGNLDREPVLALPAAPAETAAAAAS
jgi:hypothetical protein